MMSKKATTTSPLARLRAALSARSYEHRALTVVHRWYYGSEALHADLEHHAELLTDDFTMHGASESGQPRLVGRRDHLSGVAARPSGRREAHHLRSLAIEHTGSGTAHAIITHDFETARPRINDAARVRWDLELVHDPAERLPRMRTMTEQILERRATPLVEAYAENRVLAFLHYWLSLLEQPAADAEPLRELLHPDLAMTLSDGRVLHVFGEVAAWYAGAGALIDISTHHLIDPTITAATDGTDDGHDLSVDFAWEGITREGQPMIARTRHRWTLADTGERYLRLRRFAVTILDPFTPVAASEALAHHDANTG
jgi:hypothetical protein